MKLLYFILVPLLCVFVSCNKEERQENQKLSEMQGEWRLNRITNLDDNSYQVSTALQSPMITISGTTLEWKENYYSGSTQIQINQERVGTGEFEWVEDEEGDGDWEEICETIYWTSFEFMYVRNNAESLILDPGKDSLQRSLYVSRIDFSNKNMIWEVAENGHNYEFHLSRKE